MRQMYLMEIKQRGNVQCMIYNYTIEPKHTIVLRKLSPHWFNVDSLLIQRHSIVQCFIYSYAMRLHAQISVSHAICYTKLIVIKNLPVFVAIRIIKPSATEPLIGLTYRLAPGSQTAIKIWTCQTVTNYKVIF